MKLERGKLILNKGKPLVDIDGKRFNPAGGEVSQRLLDDLKQWDGREVEFERVGGQPQKVREVGGEFVSPRRNASDASRASGGARSGGGVQAAQSQGRDGSKNKESQPAKADFHNPYNFVPSPPRDTKDPALGDQQPIEHDAFMPDRYAGSIRVRMTVKTPLLVPDTERAITDQSTDHKTYPLLVDAKGKPLLPASSVRGMLRSAYEAVTNSRLGRFSHAQHSARLAFRMETQDGLRLIPARIENGHIHLLTGTSQIGEGGKPSGPMYAAWLPRYWDGQEDHRNGVRYAGGEWPVHGDEVKCWVELFQHYKWDKKQNQHVADFKYWRIRAIARQGETLGQSPAASNARSRQDRRSFHEPIKMMLDQVCGRVCVTNANINRKHDERVFFLDGGVKRGPFPVTDQHRAMWRELIQNYQSLHKDEIDKRHKRGELRDRYLGSEPGRTAWSRHVYTDADLELTEGTLCYVRLDKNQSDVEALFPVIIARELYQFSPWDILRKSLRPAATIEQLSPADRVFGWVLGDADTESPAKAKRIAARGLLRVSAVQCDSTIANAVQPFVAPGVPLAILSAPKPQQARFYVAKSPNGEAQRGGQSKRDAGYSPEKGLRGRKVYPHQKNLPDTHWNNPMEDRTQRREGTPGTYQEYRRPHKAEMETIREGDRITTRAKKNPDGSFVLRQGEQHEQRDGQNRSILGWVKPRAQFSFDIRVLNLSLVELGALLWLLGLPDGHFFRFGGGKPLGFGSVRLEIDSCDLRTGTELRDRYDAWVDTATVSDPRQEAVEAFKQALIRAYRAGSVEQIPFIQAFLRACKGHEDHLPVHYPRATENGQAGPPNPDGESFKWFVANEKNDARYALPDLDNDVGLPTLPEPSNRPGQGRDNHDARRHR